jgi:hypothetical protein
MGVGWSMAVIRQGDMLCINIVPIIGNYALKYLLYLEGMGGGDFVVTCSKMPCDVGGNPLAYRHE